MLPLKSAADDTERRSLVRSLRVAERQNRDESGLSAAQRFVLGQLADRSILERAPPGVHDQQPLATDGVTECGELEDDGEVVGAGEAVLPDGADGELGRLLGQMHHRLWVHFLHMPEVGGVVRPQIDVRRTFFLDITAD